MKKLLMMSLLALTACGGGSGDGDTDGEFTGGGDASKLVGVWDATTDEGVDGVDEYYISIDSEGFVSAFDYAGDSYDDWGDCYWIGIDVAQLSALGNNRYLSTPADLEDEEVEMVITVSGNTLTMRGVDDDPEDASNMVRSSRNVSSFTPRCLDSFEDARALIPAKKIKISAAPYLK